jgi:hypothetical protein
VAVSVDTVDTARPFRREVAQGRIIGDTANAHGKVFAAFKSEAERADPTCRVPRRRPHHHRPGFLAAGLGAWNGRVAFDLEGTSAPRVAAPARPTGQGDCVHIARRPHRRLVMRPRFVQPQGTQPLSFRLPGLLPPRGHARRSQSCVVPKRRPVERNKTGAGRRGFMSSDRDRGSLPLRLAGASSIMLVTRSSRWKTSSGLPPWPCTPCTGGR